MQIRRELAKTLAPRDLTGVGTESQHGKIGREKGISLHRGGDWPLQSQQLGQTEVKEGREGGGLRN